MKETDLSNERDKMLYTNRTLERVDAFRQLDTEQPYIWKATDKVLNAEGVQVASKYHDYILQPDTLRKLKGVAIESEYRTARDLGAGEVALMILNPPKDANPLRNKDGSTI